MKLQVECERCGKTATVTDPIRTSPVMPKSWFAIAVMAEDLYTTPPMFWSVCGDCVEAIKAAIKQEMRRTL